MTCNKHDDTKRVYIAGSLRNNGIIEIAQKLQTALNVTNNVEVFCSWFAAGPEADDYWKRYEQAMGKSYKEALKCYAAQNVFNFDKKHIDASDAFVLVLPAGKSGHLELGYFLGQGKPGFILLPHNNDRWDVMYNFATGVHDDLDDLLRDVENHL